MAEAKAARKIEGPTTRGLQATAAAHRANSKKLVAIDMKGAVQAAIASVKEYFSGAKDILLEEVELQQSHYENDPSEGRKYKKDPLWRVVISFKSGEPGTLSDVMGGDPRLYREIHIDQGNGSLRSMRAWGR